MPDVVVHNAVGAKAIANLPPKIRNIIKPEVFYFSVYGPDPYLLYRFFMFPFRHGINLRSGTMHRTKTGKFLMELARHSQTDDVFSYLAGFLCHYALDSTAHPLVYQLQGDKGYMHMAIERKLDVIELEKQGRQRRDIMKLFPSFPEIPEVRSAIKTVYGWDDDYYRISYRHMKLFYRIVTDQHGILNFLLGWTKSKFSALSYCTSLCDDMDLSGFAPLIDEAVDMATRLIISAYEYRIGKMDEESLRIVIGNRSYVGGEAEE